MALYTAERTRKIVDLELDRAASRKTILAVAGSTRASSFGGSRINHRAVQTAAETLCSRVLLPRTTAAALEFIPIYSKTLGARKAQRLEQYAEDLVRYMNIEPILSAILSESAITDARPEKTDLLDFLENHKTNVEGANPGHVFITRPEDMAQLSEGGRMPEPGEVYRCRRGKFDELVEPYAVIFNAGETPA